MHIKQIRQIIRQNRKEIAFITGNGVNRYINDPTILTWDDLLLGLWKQGCFQTLSQCPSSISLTEFYDVLDMEKKEGFNPQQKVAGLMKGWLPREHHRVITGCIRDLDAPLLTTNFDNLLSQSIESSLFHLTTEKFTDYYPWSAYYAPTPLASPTSGFGIWHINGMNRYPRSIRLGLSHYMGSVERTRKMIHKGKEDNLFYGKNIQGWNGSKTWLHIIFNRSLFIFGLGLEENEVFLRWLLIERMKYFRKVPDRKKQGWYLYKKGSGALSEGKKFFLERVGFEMLEVNEYSDMYYTLWNQF